MISYIISQFKIRSIRAIAVIAGIAIGAMLFVILTTLGDGFRKAASMPLEGVAADLIATKPLANDTEEPAALQGAKGIRQPFGMTAFNEEELSQIRALDEVESFTETLQLWDFANNNYRTILGISPNENIVGPGASIADHILEGRTLRTDDRKAVVLDKHFAAFFNYRLNDELLIGNLSFKVIGIAEMPNSNQTATSNMYIPIKDAQEIADTDSVNQVYIKVKNANDVQKVTNQLSKSLRSISIISEDSLVQVMGGIGRISARFANVAAIVGLVGGFLLGWITLSGLIAERRNEIGLMRALGWSRGEVLKVFMIETALLGVIGGVIGIFLGIIVSWGLGQIPLPDLNDTISGQQHGLNTAVDSEKQIKLPVVIPPLSILISLTSVLASALLACWLHVKRDMNYKPTKLLKS